jgi:hypothetical protein
LYSAARGGDLDVCKWLVEKGASEFDWALHGAAAEGGHLDVCKWLVEKGARDFDRALRYAQSREVKDYLLKAKEEHGKRGLNANQNRP